MKVAIPVEAKMREGNLCPSFGRSPYYLIYDSSNQEVAYLENTAADAQGGAGIKAAQLLVDEKVEALVTPRCGKNAAEVLTGANIKIFESLSGAIAENISDFQEGHLKPLVRFHAGFHGHGGQG